MAVLLEELEQKARQFAGAEVTGDFHGLAYYSPSDEPLQWDTKGKMVRLDVAIYALHVMTARLAFRSFSAIYRQKASALKVAFGKWVVIRAVKSLSLYAAKFLEVVNIYALQFDMEKAQREVEQAIRRQSIKIQRDLFANFLQRKKRSGKRRTKYVWTRHKPNNA